MKKFTRIISFVVVLLLLLLPLSACDNDENLRYGTSYIGDNLYKNGISSSSQSEIVITEDRLIVYYVSMAITSKDKDASVETIKENLRELGGYEESSDMSSDSYVHIVLRVPTVKLQDFINTIKEQGSQNYLNISSEDITERYTTAQTKLDSLLAYRERLNELAEKEDITIADLMQIEKEIYNVSAEIDSYTKITNDYKKQSDYSTVSLTIYDEEDVVPEDTLWTKIEDIFSDSINSILDLGEFLLLAIVAIAPYIVLLSVIFGVYVLIRLIICKAKKQPFTLFKKCKKALQDATEEK